MPAALARRRMMRGGVLPEKGIGGQPARLAASRAEEIAIDVIGDADRISYVGPDWSFPRLRSRSLSLWESFGIGMQSKKRPDEPFVSVRIVSE